MPQLVPALTLLAIIVLIAFISRFVPPAIYITARAAGVDGITPAALIGMRLRHVPPERIVLPLIAMTKAGVPVTADQLEAHYLAGGNVDRVANALISAHRAGIPLTFDRAAAADLAGRDVVVGVQMAVNPKVIDLPPVNGLTKNGTPVTYAPRVVLRSRVDRLLDADEAEFLARINQECGAAIALAGGSTPVEIQNAISQAILDKGLDADSGFELISVVNAIATPTIPVASTTESV